MFVPGSDSEPGWGWAEGRDTDLGPFLGQPWPSLLRAPTLNSVQESAALRTLGWRAVKLLTRVWPGGVVTVITPSDGENLWYLGEIEDNNVKKNLNEVIWIQWRKTNGWKNVCENNISSINCLDFPRWATMRFLLNRYFCRYAGF